MQADEIAKALGLIPSKLWKCIAVAENIRKSQGTIDLWEAQNHHEVLHRGTGRSTAILVRALVDVSKGNPVWISAFQEHWEDKMTRQTQAWAERLGFDPKLVYSLRRSRNRGVPEGEIRGVYVDHYQGGDT